MGMKISSVYYLLSTKIYKCLRSLEKVQVLSNGSTNGGHDVAFRHNAVIRKRNQFTDDLLASCLTVVPESEVDPGHVVRIHLVSHCMSCNILQL